MRELIALVTGLALLGGSGRAEGRTRVVATVPDLAALAREVVKERGEVLSLALPTQDPHFVDARPHLALQLNRADLLLLVGLELEAGWLPVLLTGARNPAIQRGAGGHLDLSTVVALKEVPRTRVDRSMGDIHPGGNPHYLMDPANAERVVMAIASRLSRIDAAGSRSYWQNAKGFIAELGRARRRWAERMKAHQGTAVVVHHRSWVYFTEAFGLNTVEALEPRPGIPPSSAHVLRLIQLMRSRRIPLLLQEEYYPDRTARLVAEKTGATLLTVPGGARVTQGQSYLGRLDELVQKVAAALERKRRAAP